MTAGPSPRLQHTRAPQDARAATVLSESSGSTCSHRDPAVRPQRAWRPREAAPACAKGQSTGAALSLTSSCGPMKSTPRLSSDPSACVVDGPAAMDTSAPFRTRSRLPRQGPYLGRKRKTEEVRPQAGRKAGAADCSTSFHAAVQEPHTFSQSPQPLLTKLNTASPCPDQ
jgi:hypothetical protein